MDAVVLAGEDDVAVLEEHHPARQAEVCVRPFVNLVGEGHKDGQCKQVAVQGVDMVNLRCRKGNTLRMRTHLFLFCSSAWIFRRTGIEQRTYFYVEENVRLSLFIENSPGERVRKLKAMFARGTMVSMQLSPLVSIKS